MEIKFRHIIEFSEDAGSSEVIRLLSKSIGSIIRTQDSIIKQITNMTKNQAALNNELDKLRIATAEELSQIKDILDTIKEGEPLDFSKVEEIRLAISGMSDKLAPTTPTEGKHNVKISIRTEGAETLTNILENLNCNDDQVAVLRGIYDAGVSEAQAQKESGKKTGGAMESVTQLSVDGESVTHKLETKAEKAAFDDGISAAVNEVAKAQRASIESSEDIEPAGTTDASTAE